MLCCSGDDKEGLPQVWKNLGLGLSGTRVARLSGSMSGAALESA